MRIFTLLLLLTGNLFNCLAQNITEHIYGRQGSAEEHPQQLVSTPDGSFLIAGYKTTPGSAGHFDAFIQKTDANGQPLWRRTYGGAANDLALSVAPTLDGGFVFGGYTESEGQGRADGFVKKADAAGNLQWTTLFGNTGWDQVTNVQAAAAGGYLLCGTAVYDKAARKQDAFWALLDAQGNILTHKIMAQAAHIDEAYEIKESPDGNIVVLYRSFYFTCAKYTPAGQLIWAREFKDAEFGNFRRLAIGPDGHIYLAGGLQAAGFENSPVLCLDASGNLLWKAQASVSPFLDAHIQAGADSRIRAVFLQVSSGAFRVQVFELNKFGDLLQNTILGLPAGDIMTDAAMDTTGRLFLLTQQFTQQNVQRDAALSAYQYNGAGYTPLWTQSYGDTAPAEVDAYLESCRSTRNTFFTAYYSYNPDIEGPSLWLLHTDTAGNVLSATDLVQPAVLLAAPMQATADGGCAILLYGDGKQHLLKIDAAGQLQWQKTLELPNQFLGLPAAFRVMPDGGYAIFAGSTHVQNGFQPALCRLDSQGSILWIKTLELSANAAYLENMLPLPGGGFLMQGGQFEAGSQDWNLLLAFANSTGEVQREIRHPEIQNISFWNKWGGIRHTSDGGFLLAGRIVQGTGPNNIYRNGVALLKFDAHGAHQWDNQLLELSGDAEVYFASMDEAPCQGFVLSVRAYFENDDSNLPWQPREENDLRILQWIDYSGRVRAFFNMKTYPGPSAADFDFLPGYTYYECGGKDNPNYPDIYFWRVQFPPAPDSSGHAGTAVQIAPNPSGHTMCLSFSSEYTGPLEVEIFDASGRLADRFTTVKTEQKWMSRYYNPLAGGQYFVRIKAGEEFITTHWVKK